MLKGIDPILSPDLLSTLRGRTSLLQWEIRTGSRPR